MQTIQTEDTLDVIIEELQKLRDIHGGHIFVENGEGALIRNVGYDKENHVIVVA